jgi:hypothetical protein
VALVGEEQVEVILYPQYLEAVTQAVVAVVLVVYQVTLEATAVQVSLL